MKFKKLFISLITLFGLTGFGIMKSNNTHADIASNQLAFALDHSPNQWVANNWINYYGKYWYQIDHPDLHKVWEASKEQDGSEPPANVKKLLNRERPLSEIYPNGHWNGESDIKGYPRKYKVMGHWVDYKVYKYYQKEKRNYNNEKNRDLKKLDAEERSVQRANARELRKTREWHAKHTYINHSRIHYIGYRGFSKHQWRYAFCEGGNPVDKIGLTRSYNAVMKSAKSPDNHVTYYKSEATVKPGQMVLMKLIKRVGKNAYVYRAKYRGKYYYYTNDCDHWQSEISPYTADYYKGDLQSAYLPTTYKNIYLNSHHKLHKGSSWDYVATDENDRYFKLNHGHWHETADGSNTPTWLDY